ncbi:hypothetical protein FPOAC1_002984 [Fusarium poae]|uniref:hypothetical protein n=1 Tax=Fusarium poae TaxID=36050 RepID=UPI001CEA5AD7|nr:hypothetical protein FPOAC1_002984 [Fusarium poae]KAG8676973.1 hypothetical protein FPOAC1_002984 [Fusarium poae]
MVPPGNLARTYWVRLCRYLDLTPDSPPAKPQTKTLGYKHVDVSACFDTVATQDAQSPTKMTRSHKANDRDHKGIAEGTMLPTETVPRFFGKNGFADVDPKKMKKDGSGRGNWGTVNDDIAGEQFTFTNTRRRSNSSSFSHVADFKTKFEVNEPEPVFEESLHGPEEEDHEDLTKTDSSESGRSSS